MPSSVGYTCSVPESGALLRPTLIALHPTALVSIICVGRGATNVGPLRELAIDAPEDHERLQLQEYHTKFLVTEYDNVNSGEFGLTVKQVGQLPKAMVSETKFSLLVDNFVDLKKLTLILRV